MMAPIPALEGMWLGLCDLDPIEGEAPHDTLVRVVGIWSSSPDPTRWGGAEVARTMVLTIEGVLAPLPGPKPTGPLPLYPERKSPVGRRLAILGLYMDKHPGLGSFQARNVSHFMIECADARVEARDPS